MPSVTVTISAWWPVAIVAAFAWLYIVGGQVSRRLMNHWRSFDRPRWVKPLALFLAGPLGWVAELQYWAEMKLRDRRRANPSDSSGGGA